MATSNVAIANAALQKLGDARIESLDQNSSNARSVSAAFTRTRDKLLRQYNWAFAIKRASVAADANETLYGGLNRYSLPNDFIRLILDPEDSTAVDWRIEGQYIVTKDAAPLEFRYIARIEDPNYFDSTFIDAFAADLAYEICAEITGSSGAQDRAAVDKRDAIAEAKRCGAIEKPAQGFPEDGWLSARY